MGKGPTGLGNDARRRVLDAAYDLFSRNGVRAVGVDTIIDHAGVAKMTFYRHFPSKNDLVLAFLRLREERWTRAWLEAEIRDRTSSPGGRLLAIFDVFDEWFQRPDFEGCSFINVLLEMPQPGDPLGDASRGHLATIRAMLKELAREAGVARPEDFAWKWHLIMKGSIVAAGEGDREAARRAREVATLLLGSEVGATATS